MKKLLLGLLVVFGATCGSASAMRSFFSFDVFFRTPKTLAINSHNKIKHQFLRQNNIFDLPENNPFLVPQNQANVRVFDLTANTTKKAIGSQDESLLGNDDYPEMQEEKVVIENQFGNHPNQNNHQNNSTDDENNGTRNDLGFFATHQTKLIVVGSAVVVVAATGLVAYTFKDKNKIAKAVFVPYQKVGAFLQKAIAKAKANKLKTAALLAAFAAIGFTVSDYVIEAYSTEYGDL